jgi:hypothetical protein
LIYIRPPKPLEEAKELGLPSAAPGQYDLAVTFFGQPKEQEAQGKQAEAKEGAAPPDANAVVRLHVLARVKKPKRTPKKGEAPPPDTSGRGEFTADVRSLLATDLSAGEAATTGQPKAAPAKSNSFKRLIFNSPVNNDAVRVYFYTQGNYDVALVWDIPPAFGKSMDGAIELCLESFAVDRKASNAFANGYSEEAMPELPGARVGGGGGKGGTQAF